MPDFYGDLHAPIEWKPDGDYRDISYETAEGIAKITINRPEVRNAFRPQTLFELADAFNRARDDAEVGVIILTGARRRGLLLRRRPAHPRRRRLHRRRRRGPEGHRPPERARPADPDPAHARSPSSPWWRATPSAAAMCCTSSATSPSPPTTPGSARPGPKVGSFDGGYGSGLLARIVGQKKAREIWFLCDAYDAAGALDMGLVNTVVPLAELEQTTVAWCRKMLQHSPLALRMIKASMNAADDGLAGIQQLAGDATMLFYLTEEAQEGRDAYVDKRVPDFAKFPQAPVNRWVAGARPRTLPRGGRAGARRARPPCRRRGRHHRVADAGRRWSSSLAIQVGTNYANDYSDGVRGTDDERGRPGAARRPRSWRRRAR